MAVESPSRVPGKQSSSTNILVLMPRTRNYSSTEQGTAKGAVSFVAANYSHRHRVGDPDSSGLMGAHVNHERLSCGCDWRCRHLLAPQEEESEFVQCRYRIPRYLLSSLTIRQDRRGRWPKNPGMIHAPSHHDPGGPPGIEGTREIANRGQNHWQNTCLMPDRNVDAEPRSHTSHHRPAEPTHNRSHTSRRR